MEGQNLMPSLTPARTQTLAPSMSLPPHPSCFSKTLGYLFPGSLLPMSNPEPRTHSCFS